MKNLNDFKKAQTLRDLFIEIYVNLNKDYKLKLFNDYGIDSGYDYAVYILLELDNQYNLGLRELI